MLLFFHILTRSALPNTPTTSYYSPPSRQPLTLSLFHTLAMCTLCWLIRANTEFYLRQCVGGISRHQVKPDWASDMRKHEKYKNIKKILNCRINSCQHHTSEWIKWWKVWGKLFTTFSECGKTHSFSSISSVEKRAFDGRRCSSCWTHSIHNTLCFNIHIVEFNFWLGLTLAHSLANLCQMCHVDSAQFTLKPLTFFSRNFFSYPLSRQFI